MTVPGIRHGRLLLSPQQWRSRALASSQGTCLPRYLCTWKCLWIQVRDCIRSATRAAVYYTTSEGAPTLKCESACYRPFFQKPWNNNGLWLERYPWVTLAAFHKVELFTVQWIKERVAGGASLFHMNGACGGGLSNIHWQCSIPHDTLGTGERSETGVNFLKMNVSDALKKEKCVCVCWLSGWELEKADTSLAYFW